MKDKSKKVNLKPIDPKKLKIEKSGEFPEAYTFELELDPKPDSVWIGLFGAVHQQSFYPMKRQVYVQYDSLKVVTAPDEIKNKIERVKSLVNDTNAEVEKYNKKVEEEWEADRQRKAKEAETIKKMRERLE